MTRVRRIPLPEAGPDGKPVPLSHSAPNLARALDGYQDSVVLLDRLDPVTTELVRLRCARTHNCFT
ncbi:MAG: hypothetical protein ACKVVT_10585 [Dehalococcoidia bacterium]